MLASNWIIAKKRETDIPKTFTINESAYRIHGPSTAQKYMTLGQVLRMPPGIRILDLGGGSGEMLHTWAHDHGISSADIDMSQLFSEQAILRASESGVTEHMRFIYANVTGYIAEEKFDIAARVGTTWIAGGVIGTVKQLEQSLKPGRILLIGEPYWRQMLATEEIATACGATSVVDFPSLSERVSSFGLLGYDVIEMVLVDQEGRNRYKAIRWLTMCRWLEANPDDDFTAKVREQLRGSPVRYVTFAWEYIGWGMFAFVQR